MLFDGIMHAICTVRIFAIGAQCAMGIATDLQFIAPTWGLLPRLSPALRRRKMNMGSYRGVILHTYGGGAVANGGIGVHI